MRRGLTWRRNADLLRLKIGQWKRTSEHVSGRKKQGISECEGKHAPSEHIVEPPAQGASEAGSQAEQAATKGVSDGGGGERASAHMLVMPW